MEQNQHITDQVLLAEIKQRLDERSRSVEDQKGMLLELETLNKRLRDADSVKTAFLSNIRNEVNNPLASIMGLAEQLMRSESLDNERAKHMLSLIARESLYLDFQMRNLFSAADIEAGEADIALSKIDASKIIESQINYLELRAAKLNLKVQFEDNTAGKTIITDASMLQSIVMNLLDNAIKFSPEGAEIRIKSNIKEDQLHVEVRDFGEGIMLQDYKHIFDRFRQLEVGTTKRYLGHGLGLSIVKEFADKLEGNLHIASDPGTTTLITVVLPDLSSHVDLEGASEEREILSGNAELF